MSVGKAREMSPLPFLPSAKKNSHDHQQATRRVLAPPLQITLSSSATLYDGNGCDMVRSCNVVTSLLLSFQQGVLSFARPLEH